MPSIQPSARIAEGLELTDRFAVIPARLEMMATRGFLELSLGRNDEADRTLTEVAAAAEDSGLLEPALFRYHGDAIEAKIALGRLDEAATLVDRVEHLAATLQRPWLALIAGRGSGLLQAARGQLDDACDVLAAALAEDRAGQPFERARTLLAFGSVQRRHRQKRGARDALDRGPRHVRRTRGERCGSTRPPPSWPGWVAARPPPG